FRSLAQAGELEEALGAYDLALERDPQLEQARYNRQLVESLLRQREAERQAPPEQPVAAQPAPDTAQPTGAGADDDAPPAPTAEEGDASPADEPSEESPEIGRASC